MDAMGSGGILEGSTSRTPVGLIGYVLLSADLDTIEDSTQPLYWWRDAGGFVRVPLPFPKLFNSRRACLDFVRQLNRREYTINAYPARLALANAR